MNTVQMNKPGSGVTRSNASIRMNMYIFLVVFERSGGNQLFATGQSVGWINPQQGNHHGKQGYTFYQGRSDNHVGTNITNGFRLTGDGFQGATTDTAYTDTGSYGCQTGADGSDPVDPAS